MKCTRQIVVAFSFVFILLALGRSVFADKTSHFEIAYQLTGLILDKKMIHDSVSMMGDIIKAGILMDPGMQPYRETVTKIVVDTIGEIFDDDEYQRRFREEVAKAYVELFTETELQEMITFYSSNVGQKVTRTQPELARRILAIGMEMGESSSAKVRQKLEERFREAQEMGLLPKKQSGSEDSEFFINRGIEYEQKGQHDQAISDFNQALEINPRHAKAYMNRGIAYSRKGQYDQAISDFNRALEINPRSDKTYNSRGYAYEKKGQYDQAISDYTRAIEISPDYALVYSNRGRAYEKKGQYAQAISDFNRALEVNPIFAGGYNALAWFLATAKDTALRNGEKAVELALKACELTNWGNPIYLDTLAAAYARIGDFDNAVKWQQKAIESTVLAKNTEVQQRLNLYRQRKAWPADSIGDVAVAPPPPTPSPKPTPPWHENEYVNPVCKWSIRYPNDWKVDSSNPSFVMIQPAIDPAIVGIHCGTVDYSSLDDFVNSMLVYTEDVLKLKGLTTIVMSRQPISLPNNISGIDVIVEIRPGGKSRRVYVLVNKQAFNIDAETYIEKWDMFHPYFERIINSFTVPK